MEKHSTGVTCPRHPSEIIQRVNLAVNASQHLYCLECILQQDDKVSARPQLKTLTDFLNSAAAFYLRKKDSISTVSETPDEYTHVIAKQNDVLTELTNHISAQKKKVEYVFDEITQEVLSLITEKKNEYLHTLDQQVFNLRYWYIFFEKQLKKTFPTQKDISQLFPSKEDLTNKLNKISNITQLQAFVRSMKEDLNEDKINVETLGRRNDEEIQKKKLDDLSKKLSKVETTQPVFSNGELDVNGMRDKVKDYFKGLFEKMFVIRNPIIDVLQAANNIISNIIQENDYSLLKEWLPEKYKNMTPQLLFRSSRDGCDATKFHSLCDNKGPTITLVKSKNKIIGGFADKSWHSKNKWITSDEAFLFSITSKLKCPILENGKQNAMYGAQGVGPCFGTGHDLMLMHGPSGHYSVQSSYQNSGKLLISDDVPNNNPGNGGFDFGGGFGFSGGFNSGNTYFEISEIEVFLLNQTS